MGSPGSGSDSDDARCVAVHRIHAVAGNDLLEGHDAARAELGAGVLTNLAQGIRGVAGGPVDTGREHRVEGVGHG